MGPRLRPRRGGHTIEFALLLPVWVAIMSAIMDFGWLFYQQATLDAAANVGCRAGSLVDPGTLDANIGAVEDRATDRMLALLESIGEDDCDSCVVEAHTTGAPPRRSLVCEAHRDMEPLVGLFVSPRTLDSLQVARLEWQREAAP